MIGPITTKKQHTHTCVFHAFPRVVDEQNLGSLTRTYFGANDISDDLIELMSRHSVEEAWYFYERGCYSGDGDLVGRVHSAMWLVFSLSHCSCYGPGWKEEPIEFYSANKLREYRFSEERQRELSPLIDAAVRNAK